MHGSVFDCAQALLRPLREIAPLDGIAIALIDSVRRLELPLIRSGHPSGAARLFDTPGVFRNDQSLGRPQHGALRSGDLPRRSDEIDRWARRREPAGFTDRIALVLKAEGERPVGVFCAQTADPQGFTREAVQWLHKVAPLIARAVDPLRNVCAMVDIVARARAVVVVTHDGMVEPLHGYPEEPALRPGSPVIQAVRTRMAELATPIQFLTPVDGAYASAPLCITALPCRTDPFERYSAIVVAGPAGDLHGLTHRELEVLGLLVEGFTNAAIARHLFIASRTAVGHVERIMRRLHAATRTMAATQAVRGGLYIPRELSSTAVERPA